MEIKMFFLALVALLLLGSTCTCAADATCKEITLDFIIKDNDPEVAAVEDEIVQDLAKIGIKINTCALNSSAYIEAKLEGDYHMMSTRTWGAPYDPHSYLNSWSVPAHVEYSAIGEMEPPLTRDNLLQMISDVQVETDPLKILKGWEKIQQAIHSQVIFLPLWGTRVPYVLNRRFAGFVPSTQTYEYPLDSVKILSGSENVTIAPGAGGSLFESVGPVNPHQYYPNQLFAQSWVYEGLVGYGQDGEIIPVLATAWTIEDLSSGGSRYIFTLREGVKFHDGSEWNCSVAKLNFDHVFSDTVKARHQWYGTTSQLTSWTCSAGKFVLETKDKYYPLLQELTYIRPLTFAAASAFSRGLDSHPDLHNSCNSGDFGSKWAYLEDTITCAGLKPIGTGPFKVLNVNEAVFARHDNYWGPVPDIKFLHLKSYQNTDEVERDLLTGKLDMALGIGPLTAAQVKTLKFYHSDVVDVRHSDVMQHALMIMNTNAVGTKDVKLRQAIIHAVDKARFIKEEFAGLKQPLTQILPDSAPYRNVDLNPKWAFDFEKVELLNCPVSVEDGGLPSWATIIIIIVSVAFAVLLTFTFVMYYREKQGRPVFTRLETVEPEATFADTNIFRNTAEKRVTKQKHHSEARSRQVNLLKRGGGIFPQTCTTRKKIRNPRTLPSPMALSNHLAALAALICASCVLAQSTNNCTSALETPYNPVSGPTNNVWTVDPFIIPPRGRCTHLPVDTIIPGNAHFLRMNFDNYPNITAQCDDKIKFVMRTRNIQQRHGVYLANRIGNVIADSATPCPPPVKTQEKPCDVRLNETHNVSTECEGYISLDPRIISGLIMFGPDNTLIREYTTPALRTLLAAGRDSETLVFSCPWVQAGPTSHCFNGMFVRVKVNGCTTPTTGPATGAASVLQGGTMLNIICALLAILVVVLQNVP